MGSIKRVFTCCVIDPNDTVAFLGTKTGDILEISLERALFKRIGPVKRLFSQGVNCVNLLSNGDLLIGAGDGTIAKIGYKDMLIKSES
jgi:cilia- and flagella-associated protein 52